MPKVVQPLTVYRIKSFLLKVKKQDIKLKKLSDSVTGLKLKISLMSNGEPSALWIYQKQKSKSCPFTLDMSHGSYPDVSIESARQWAREITELIAKGLDPRKVKAQRIANELEAKEKQLQAKKELFGDLFVKWCDHKEKRGEWSNRLKEEQRSRKHFKAIWATPVKEISTQDIISVISPIWCSNPTTVDKLMNHLSGFFAWCYGIAKVLDTPINPADRKMISMLLPPASARKKPQNFPFMEPEQLPALAKVLWDLHSSASLCTLFGILCCLRSSNAREVKWSYIDDGFLTFPAEVMKETANGQHKIPLSDEANQIIQIMIHRSMTKSYVFASTRKRNAPFSESTLNKIIKTSHEAEVRAGREGWIDRIKTERTGKPIIAVYHGIARATFKTWAETNRLDKNVTELILHHGIDDKYNGAYNRADLIEAKRQVLSEWAKFVCSQIQF